MNNITKDINILRKKSVDVSDAIEAREIIDKIKPLLIEEHMVGIAAIQIGINKKIAVMKHQGDFFYLINPIVLEKNENVLFFNEGCLSFPNKYITTNRYKHFVIKNHRIENEKLEEEILYFYYSRDKDDVEYGSSDMFSIAIQHEIDHFEGVLFMDRKSEPIKSPKKIGRNDPCGCGSGKKFKKCCGLRE